MDGVAYETLLAAGAAAGAIYALWRVYAQMRTSIVETERLRAQVARNEEAIDRLREDIRAMQSDDTHSDDESRLARMAETMTGMDRRLTEAMERGSKEHEALGERMDALSERASERHRETGERLARIETQVDYLRQAAGGHH